MLLSIACKETKQKEMEQISSNDYTTFKVSDSVDLYRISIYRRNGTHTR